jgi:hypothetical protein
MMLIPPVVLRRIGPGQRHKLPAAIGENQQELELALATCALQDRQRFAFERMGLAKDRDCVGNVFETGSVL